MDGLDVGEVGFWDGGFEVVDQGGVRCALGGAEHVQVVAEGDGS